jgi:hypothetical protein
MGLTPGRNLANPRHTSYHLPGKLRHVPNYFVNIQGRESKAHPAFCIIGGNSGEPGKLATPKIRVWVRFTSGMFLSRLNLSQFIAAFKTENSIVRHPDMTIATDLEEFPTRT